MFNGTSLLDGISPLKRIYLSVRCDALAHLAARQGEGLFQSLLSEAFNG